MPENGIAKHLTSANLVISILIVIVSLVTWLVVLNEDVKDNTEQLLINTPKTQENKECIIAMQRDIEHIREGVDKIYEKVK